MVKQLLSAMCAVVLLAGVAMAQTPSMPGPGGVLLSAVAATTTSAGFSMPGYGVVTFQTVTSGSSTGTVAYQGSLDGTNWTQMSCWLTGTTTLATSTVTSAATAAALVTCNTDGIPLVRAVLSPWTSGTWTVNVGSSYLPRTK